MLALIIGCASTQRGSIPTIDVLNKSDSQINVNIDTTLKVEDDKDTLNVLTITNKKTGKKWEMTYNEWKVMTTSYKYWGYVSKQQPRISDVIEDDHYIYIMFNYYDVKSKDVLGFKFKKEDSILAGKVLVPKRYLVARDESKKNLYIGVATGTSAYALLVTLLLLIAL